MKNRNYGVHYVSCTLYLNNLVKIKPLAIYDKKPELKFRYRISEQWRHFTYFLEKFNSSKTSLKKTHGNCWGSTNSIFSIVRFILVKRWKETNMAWKKVLFHENNATRWILRNCFYYSYILLLVLILHQSSRGFTSFLSGLSK